MVTPSRKIAPLPEMGASFGAASTVAYSTTEAFTLWTTPGSSSAGQWDGMGHR